MTTTSRRQLRRAGVLFLFLGTLAAIEPALITGMPVLAHLNDFAAGLVLPVVLLATAIAIVGALLVGNWTDAPTSDDGDGFAGASPSGVSIGRSPDRASGPAGIDSQIERAVAGDRQAIEAVRERLRALVRDRYRDVQADGTEALRSGGWTRDDVAGRFLAVEDTSPEPWSDRLRLWLDPVGERRRRIARTVAAIESIAVEGGGNVRETVAGGPIRSEKRNRDDRPREEGSTP